MIARFRIIFKICSIRFEKPFALCIFHPSHWFFPCFCGYGSLGCTSSRSSKNFSIFVLVHRCCWRCASAQLGHAAHADTQCRAAPPTQPAAVPAARHGFARKCENVASIANTNAAAHRCTAARAAPQDVDFACTGATCRRAQQRRAAHEANRSRAHAATHDTAAVAIDATKDTSTCHPAAHPDTSATSSAQPKKITAKSRHLSARSSNNIVTPETGSRGLRGTVERNGETSSACSG